MVDDATAPAVRRQIASDLLTLGAVALAPDEPFTWSSGLRAPIYCDNRLTLADPIVRERIADGFAQCIAAQALEPQVVAGTATAGIPHAAWLADRLRLPMVYVRAQPKAHGRGQQIEGRSPAGQRVVLVEDLVSTGGSSIGAVEALRKAGARVVAVLAIFSYGLAAAEAAFESAQVPLYTLTDVDALLDVAVDAHRLAPEAVEVLHAWRRDPQAWSDQYA